MAKILYPLGTMEIVIKKKGETPLQCLERIRKEVGIGDGVPMTYAGRLDPMAHGKLLILVGEECKQKDKYLALDKEYIVEVLFGVSSYTHDVLGKINKVDLRARVDVISIELQNFVGKFKQKYPAYSSKTVGGVPLFAKARSGELPEEMPEKEVEIYSIELIGQGEVVGKELAKRAVDDVMRLKEEKKGDFRQEEIVESWQSFTKEHGGAKFVTAKFKIKCSSGTYMRVFAERIAREQNTCGLALDIERTEIFVDIKI